MKMRISSKDLILLSAYLDGELSASEKQGLEKRLRSNTDLQNALREMQITKTMIKLLPRKRAPRSFIITESMARQLSNPLSRLIPIFSYTSAASFVLALVLLLVNFIPSFSGVKMAAPAYESAMEIESADMAREEEAPAIILWDNSTADGLSDAMGKGGGEEPMPQAEVMEMAPMEMEEPAEEMLVEEAMPEEESYAAEAMEEEAVEPQSTQVREIPQPNPTALSMEKSTEEENGLILGIAPDAQNSQPGDGEIAEHAAVEEYDTYRSVNWLLIAEITLIALAVLSAMLAIILRRKI